VVSPLSRVLFVTRQSYGKTVPCGKENNRVVVTNPQYIKTIRMSNSKSTHARYCLELILPSRSSHFSNVTMIDSFFLIQSLFFLLVIANTTTPLVSYPFIRHELLACYPFQNVFISLWFCAVRACVLLLLLIRFEKWELLDGRISSRQYNF
jgi:hypothetical protein